PHHCGAQLSGHESAGSDPPDVRVSRTAVGGTRSEPAHRSLHRLSTLRTAAVSQLPWRGRPMSLIASPLRLRRLGVLGMNRRNADYIMRYNPRRLYPLVDNKL